MKTCAAVPAFRWFAAAMFVAVGQWAIAPRTAEARCGDYVLVHGQTSPHSAMIEPSGDPSQHVDDMHHPLPSERLPCSGPNCSRDEGLPSAPPPAAPDSSVQQWGVIVSLPALPLTGSRFGAFEGDARFAGACASSLFRPPRSCS